MKSMFVTSPHFGDTSLGATKTEHMEVMRRQRILDGKNVFKTDFLQGNDGVDGDFGVETGRACTRAKYWCGYPDKSIVATYGDLLDGYLKGTTELPADYDKRRKARLKKAQEVTLSQKILDEAMKYLGVKESPAGSNNVIFTKRWGMIGPWCDMFVSCTSTDAGSKIYSVGNNWAYVPYHLHAAWNADFNGISLSKTQYVVPGDGVCFDWNDDGIADHIGIFIEWTNSSRTAFRSIEGNTSAGNNSNGGQVQIRDRVLSDLAKIYGNLGFMHVAR